MRVTRTKQQAARGITYEPYEHCPFCKGRGCFGCKERKRQDEAAALKAEQDQKFLNDHLLFTAHYDNPEEMATLREVFHADRLRGYFDTSDLTDEDVYRHLGGGDTARGRQTLAMAVSFAKSGFAPTMGFHDTTARMSETEIRQFALDRIKNQIAAERGGARIVEALRGKAGSKV